MTETIGPDEGTSRPLYDSRAMTLVEWHDMGGYVAGSGWECKQTGDMIYLRKHLSGPLNTDSEGWTHAN